MPPFLGALSTHVAVTDLLSKIPFPPSGLADAPDEPTMLIRPAEAPRAGEGAARSFEIELPSESGTPRQATGAPSVPSPEGDDAPPLVGMELPKTLPADRVRTESVPLPSYAVILIGGLALLCLVLTVALATVLTTTPAPSAPVATPAPAAELPHEAPTASPPRTPAAASTAEPAASASPASFPGEPLPIPIDLLTRLEEASDEPLDVELTRLLDAIQHGFGTRSARMEPTLRSYVYRTASRFEWTPDSFRVAVTAPAADLAQARATLLADLFEEAVASGHLQIGSGAGPHALTLVSE